MLVGHTFAPLSDLDAALSNPATQIILGLWEIWCEAPAGREGWESIDIHRLPHRCDVTLVNRPSRGVEPG